MPRTKTHKKIESDKWYALKVEVKGNQIKGYVDDELLIDYHADRDLRGYVGIWTKADSVTYFDKLTIETKKRKTIFNY